ncbi:uncharacterized protein LOC129377493 [Poeciliopsis prolifica]|uniref:uncharacterized protein LOC129377493 n=1 Tax=Poeciliopsis prolifica TaxID=188132 RepID=UPI002413D9C6|nr:uncharacterized protein LOC129377493 [Poeciliopsis prolifica]
MMDTQKDIRDAIRAVLPGLSQEVLAALEDVLEKLGTTTADDFQYITEEDLLPVLKPIQARRLVAAWAQNNSMASTSGGASSSPQSVQSSQPAASLSQPSSADTSSPSLSCSPVLPTWVDSCQIPWQKLPEELIQTLERHKRPSARLQRQMVRIIVSEMMLICKNPTKRDTTEIAERMVSRYPKSLKDVIDGDVIGLGYHSLVKQLQARIENVKRQDTPKITKRKASVQYTYGCVNWAPKFLPLSETVEKHFQQLTGISLMEAFFTNLDKKGERILNFLQTVFAQKENKFWSLSSS